MRMRAKLEKDFTSARNPAELGFTAPDEFFADLVWSTRDRRRILIQGFQPVRPSCSIANWEKFPNVDIDDIYLGNGVSRLMLCQPQELWITAMRCGIAYAQTIWTAAVSLAEMRSLYLWWLHWVTWYWRYQSKYFSFKAIVLINPGSNWSLLSKELLLGIIELLVKNDLSHLCGRNLRPW